MEPQTLKLVFVVLVFLVGFASCNIDQDKERCGNQVVGLAPCLTYVGGQSKAPTMDCCTGLKQVVKNSFECVCVLVKDRDDPSLGFKINATLALTLPVVCHAPANISDCPHLLLLPPNSTEAKVFYDFDNVLRNMSGAVPPISGNSSSARAASPTMDDHKSDGGRKMGWLSADWTSLWLILITLVAAGSCVA